MNKKVSIITASYNYAQYIEQAIESIINQTYDNWELIIVDDGSKDNSIEVIQKYAEKDSRIKLFTHENNQNLGLIKTLELGIKNSTGDFAAFLESDDYLEKDYLEKKINIFNKYQDVGFIYNDINIFGTENNYYKLRKKVTLEVSKYWKKHDFPHYISDIFYLRNLVPTFSCVMLKKDLLNEINFESPRASWTDWWLWAQVSNLTKFYYINEMLTNWRVHPNSYDTAKIDKKITYDFYNKLYEKLNPIKSIKYNILFLIKQFCRYIKYWRV